MLCIASGKNIFPRSCFLGSRNLLSKVLCNVDLLRNSLSKFAGVTFWEPHSQSSSRNLSRLPLLKSCEAYVCRSQCLLKHFFCLGSFAEARTSLCACHEPSKASSGALAETWVAFAWISGRLFPYSIGYGPVCYALPQVRKNFRVPVFWAVAIYLVKYCVMWI